MTAREDPARAAASWGAPSPATLHAPSERGRALAARLLAAAALAWATPPARASPGAFSAVDPARIEAGSWYDGATIHVRGSVGAASQVAVRVTGPEERRAFNRRARIGGLLWGGVEHVWFDGAPSLYAVFTSAALGALAPGPVRERLSLGYDPLAAHATVRGHGAGDQALFRELVKLKESEGLYRIDPGAVRLSDAEGGRRAFDVAVPIPSTAPPGELDVAVFELADGAVVAHDAARVELRRVGMPAFLFRLSHEQGALSGILAVVVLLATGVAVDLLGSRRRARPHPALVLLSGLARTVDEAVLAARHRPRTRGDVALLQARYRLFRALLALNNEVLEDLTELEEESTWTSFRHPRVRMGIRALFDGTADLVGVLNELTEHRYFDLANVVATLRADVFRFLAQSEGRERSRLTLALSEIRSETASEVGDKALHLARVECDLGLRVPEGFVVTVAAYHELLEAGGLAARLRAVLAPARADDPEDFRRRCEEAQALVRGAAAPGAVADAIEAAARSLGDGERFAVRSSAAGEGGPLSFAGQFESCLNVPGRGLLEAWKRVVASRYAPRAVFYRRAAGLADVDTPMAVLVQRMVPARASGVLFTRLPDEPRGRALVVSATVGLGMAVSAGTPSADQLLVAREAPHAVLRRRISRKPARLVGAQDGVVAVALEEREQLRASIDDGEASRLAAAALAVERYFGAPQDLEWAFSERGELFILQARALRVERPRPAPGPVPEGARPLLRGGDPVWHGRAVGPVHVARTAEELEATGRGDLLVVPELLPDAVAVLPRVCGVVVERGAITGHAASLLREFRVPSLVGAAGAVASLATGAVVSLDVASRGVYAGALWPELRGRVPATALGERSLGLPAPLAGKLTKLSGAFFVGSWACQSLHDVVRFAHEKAIQAMFEVGDHLLASPLGGMRRVESREPLFVHLLDLGGGLRPGAGDGRSVRPEDVASAPFRALWRGLADAAFLPRRPERPPPSPSVLAATRAMSPGDEGAPNYACVTESYLNLNSRGGIERERLRVRPRRQAYHFVVVDSFLSENRNENHIRLRLKGGGAAPWQRTLRAEVGAGILRARGFTATVTGDLLNGWMAGVDRSAGAEALATIGRLLRFLARLDLWMTGEAEVGPRVEAFLDAEARARGEARADVVQPAAGAGAPG